MTQNNNANSSDWRICMGGIRHGDEMLGTEHSSGEAVPCQGCHWGRHGDTWEEVTWDWRNTDSQKQSSRRKSDHTHEEGLCSVQVWWSDTFPVGHGAKTPSSYTAVVHLCMQWSLGVFPKGSEGPACRHLIKITTPAPGSAFKQKTLCHRYMYLHTCRQVKKRICEMSFSSKWKIYYKRQKGKSQQKSFMYSLLKLRVKTEGCPCWHKPFSFSAFKQENCEMKTAHARASSVLL